MKKSPFKFYFLQTNSSLICNIQVVPTQITEGAQVSSFHKSKLV